MPELVLYDIRLLVPTLHRVDNAGTKSGTLTKKSISRTLLNICSECERVSLVDNFSFSGHELSGDSGHLHLIKGPRQT